MTKAGIRKMIARLHEELAVYEGSREVDAPEPSPMAYADPARESESHENRGKRL